MKFRIHDLQNYLTKKINGEKIAQTLTLKSFETTYKNNVLDIDILPNRFSNCASFIGLAKEISAVSDNNVVLPKINFLETKQKINKNIKVINRLQSNIVPYYFYRIILNINNKKSEAKLADLLNFYGFNNINYLVDLSNFVMLECGAPLHIFDLDKIDEFIEVRTAHQGERFLSFDDKEYILQGNEIVIADAKDILALAGIKGGKKAAVTLQTKNIFIEGAVFNPASIYSTSKQLNIKTEASFRFEKGIAPTSVIYSLDRLTTLIYNNLGGDILINKNAQIKFNDKIINFNFEEIYNLSGCKIEFNEFQNIIKKLGITIKRNHRNKIFQLIIPNERLDINNSYDIVEEIIRIYGLDKITPKFECFENNISPKQNFEFIDFLRNFTIKSSFTESFSYNLISEKDLSIFKSLLNGKPIKIYNPLSENYSFFQFSLIPNLVKAIISNQKNFTDIKLFNIEKIAFWQNNKIIEKYSYAIAIGKKNIDDIFLELKGFLNLLMNELKIDYLLSIQDNENFYFAIMHNKKNIGTFGFLNKYVLNLIDSDINIGFVELDLDLIYDLSKKEKIFNPLPQFPSIIRDLSFFINRKISVHQIEKILLSHKVDYLKKIELKDIYLPLDNKDTKSVTYRFYFQSDERTLTDEEINQCLVKIINILKNQLNIEIR